MKPTTIAKSALALALGTVACAASAAVTSEQALKEDFEGFAINTAIVGQATNSLTWSRSGTADLSYVTNNIMGDASNKALKVQTEGDTLSATIQSTAKDDINDALTNGIKSVTFKCSAILEPTDDLESISGADLKFALYAYAHDTTTNLVVYGINKTSGTATNNVTDISIPGGETAIDVTITNITTGLDIYVTVGGVTRGPFGAVTSTAISQLDISGNGVIDDIEFSYLKAAAGGYVPADESVPETSDGQSITLTQDQADYLNDVLSGNSGTTKEQLNTKLHSMSKEQFVEAYALNTDIVKDNGAPAYTFNITSIRPNASNVDLTIVLDRTHGLGAINGTLKFFASANGTTWGEPKSYEITNDHFATGDIATLSVPKGDGNFFKATIE